MTDVSQSGVWRWGPKQRRGGIVGRALDGIWRVTIGWSITLEGELVWWCADDDHLRKRKLDYELRVPRVLWRPYCWWRGMHDEYYGSCVFCDTPMKERR